MGAMDWDCFTSWNPDIEAAFRTAQSEESDRLGGDPMELLMASGEDGTHSILDLFAGVSKTGYLERDPRDHFMAFPVPEDWLKETYGTNTPTRQMVEKTRMDQLENLKRGTGIYFAVWEHEGGKGNPQWWYFYGCTGD